MVEPLNIQGRMVGVGFPCFIIAEAGVNHNGSLDIAKRLVDVAAQSGVDAVKFQTYVAEKLVTADAVKARYQREASGYHESQLEMLKRLELTREAHVELVSYCARRCILFLSSPFDEESADFLDSLGVPAYKIASGEITNIPFLQHVAKKGKPLIVSTGMATLDEVREAVEAIRTVGGKQIALLHCVSSYPASPERANLRAMKTIEQSFPVISGYSDHTPGLEVSLAAVALGANIIEKHFTLDRSYEGPDHRVSLEPNELQALSRGIRNVEVALGNGLKQPTLEEMDTAAAARKSLVAAKKIKAGEVLTREMIAVMRPGTGLSPSRLNDILGKTLAVDVCEGELLSLEMVV